MAVTTAGHLSSTSQEYLNILDITNDLVVLQDCSTGMVLQVSAINFGLLSEPEQDAIIYAYAALINSLSFSLQILIKSKPKDVSNYLHYVDEQLTEASSDLRRQQIAAYRQFVANLITERNVLDKTFYIVLPLSALELGLVAAANPLSAVTPKKNNAPIDKHYVIEKSLNVLIPRRDHMINQFARLGLRARQLDTKDLIYLFYVTYNPQASEGARVVNTREYTTPLIQTQGVAAMPTMASAQTQPAAPMAPTAPTEQPGGLAVPAAVAPAAPTTPPVIPPQNVMTGAPR